MAKPTPWNLRGGVAVVTGAASGIGAGLAQVLAGRGMHLALVDRNAQALEAVAAQARARGVQVSTHVLDVTDQAGLAALPAAVLAAHQHVTLLVNNAGVALGGSFLQVKPEDFDWLMSINFGAVVRLTRGFLPLLAREPRAHIVNISSIYGIIAPPGQTAYCASKFAVRGFSEALRHELWTAQSPVGLTVVHPGGVDTNIASSAKVSEQVTAEQREMGRKAWAAAPKLSPLAAAERIAKAVEQREDRLILGKDAERATLMQRLFPVTYYQRIARAYQKRAAKNGTVSIV
jgi:short-subunit dehydrogenase